MLICQRDRSFGFLQIIGNFGELSECGLEVFDNGVRGNGRHGPEARRVREWKERINFGGDNIGIDRWQRVLRPPALRREAPKP